jgi:hypothetical protein
VVVRGRLSASAEKNVGLVARLEGAIDALVQLLHSMSTDAAVVDRALRLLSLYASSSGAWLRRRRRLRVPLRACALVSSQLCRCLR